MTAVTTILTATTIGREPSVAAGLGEFASRHDDQAGRDRRLPRAGVMERARSALPRPIRPKRFRGQEIDVIPYLWVSPEVSRPSRAAASTVNTNNGAAVGDTDPAEGNAS